MATAKPRVIHSKNYRPDSEMSLAWVPGAVAGFGMGLLFINLVNIGFSSAENAVILILCLVIFIGVPGILSYFLGEYLAANEAPASKSKLFNGSTRNAAIAHGALWGVLFIGGSIGILALNPESVSLIQERVANFNKPVMQPAPIPIPSSPSAGRRPKSVFDNANQDDPNRIKSSPSRYDPNGTRTYNPRNPSPESGATSADYLTAEQQAKRDTTVVQTLKGLGLKTDGVSYEEKK